MIATHVTNARLFEVCFDRKNLYFLIMRNRPRMGHFSAGELNVIR